MKKTIFISYSSHDRDFVDRLSSALREISPNYEIDRNLDFKHEQEFIHSTVDAINRSSAFIYIASDDSYKNNWTQTEIIIAVGSKRKDLSVIPAIISNNPKIPPLLRYKRSVDFRDPKDFDKKVRELHYIILKGKSNNTNTVAEKYEIERIADIAIETTSKIRTLHEITKRLSEQRTRTLGLISLSGAFIGLSFALSVFFFKDYQPIIEHLSVPLSLLGTSLVSVIIGYIIGIADQSTVIKSMKSFIGGRRVDD